ncbi:DMT family transporter [Burkholderia cepacia]|uniref:DMT family transporter n=1 Tax=Burkholderia cepacia TaxID=292 RepID=UPI001C967F7D|nr:DMT family transporter [Burkholderia cepacia]MBY4801988.1 DMT family transporter [Burkholderia cepacia]MCA8331467.1 DMT family transporter [Burkholderia cepacia]
MRTNKRKGVALTILATLCWGGGMVLSKRSLRDVNETTLFAIQLIAAWGCTLALVVLSRKLSIREWKHGWLGILEPGVAFYLVLIGLSKTSAINATILQAMEGLMIIGLAFSIFRDRVSPSVLLWGCLATLGAVLVTTKESIFAGISINSGDWLVLLGTLFAAAYVTLSSRIVGDQNSPESLLFWQLSFCVLLVLGYLAVTDGLSFKLVQFNFYSLSSGALSYGLSFYFYLRGMRYIPTSLSAILLCLTPIFGASMSVLFLSETISFQNFVGLLMILASSIAITRSSDTVDPHPAKA